MTKTNESINPIPKGYTTVTPWMISRNSAQLLDFIKRAFDGEEIARIYTEDGSVGHAEIRIGNAVIMMFDAKEEWPDTPGFLRLYVEDGDAVFEKALQAGATAVTQMTNLAFGERVGRVRDPLNNIWWIHQRLEELDYEEMSKRAGKKEYIEAMKYVQESLKLR
ncbi:VOC family protein [Paenibacillus sp. NPDC056579]|uniref:VOC family protein n=1 Tax=unclassified Paenibacillus TaxID=185978 RepID=UPI001EF95B59|nr:VOC family protein [Paenibacillus sp. H1-7]ULL14840.1 VOC family protein [Paenibacillus sp. H1-7]